MFPAKNRRIMAHNIPSHQLPNTIKVSNSPPHKYNTSLHSNNNCMEICKSPDSNKRDLLRPRISVLPNQKSPKSLQSSPVISKKLSTESLRSTRSKVYKVSTVPIRLIILQLNLISQSQKQYGGVESQTISLTYPQVQIYLK